MQRFQRYDDHGWFKVGQVEATTSVLLAAATTVSVVLWVVSKTLFVIPLILTDAAIRGLELWRLVSWPFVNDPDIWIILSIAMVFLVGSDIEREVGRRRYAWMIGAIVVIPAAAASLFEPMFAYGINHVVSALFVVLVLWRPMARTFFDIPLWVIVVLFEVLQLLQLLDARNSASFAGLFTFWGVGLIVAALMARSFDLTEFTQITKLPMPQFVTGDPYAKSNRAREKAQRNKTKGSTPLRRRADKGPAPVIPIRPEPRLDRADQADMDALLDKISETGIDSLTPDERRRLDEHSRRLRGQ